MRFLALALLLAATPATAAEISDTSFKDATGMRVLRESVVVAASPSAVWQAFTQDDLFAQWSGAPVAHIVPGNGGTMEFALMPGGKIGDPMNVRHRIDVYEPDALLIFHNEFVPSGGPIDAALFPIVRTMLTFDDLGSGKTKVTETVIGFGNSAAYDGLYNHLQGGNAEYLESLAKYFDSKH